MAIGRQRRREQPNWLRDPLYTRARALPSLDLDFAGTQSLIDRISGQSLITFTRASNGTRINAAGALETLGNDVPRITFDAATGRCLGLLVEEARTNLLLWSEEFDNAAWGKTRSTISANASLAPDGTLTADKLVEDNQTGAHHTNRSALSFVSGTAYTLSGFYKAAERTRFQLALGNGGTPFPTQANHVAVFDLSAGTVVSSGSSVTARIERLANGWFRCSISATAQATATDSVFPCYLVSTGTTISYTGDNSSGLLLWGAQLEAGTFPTSYIGPTTTLAVARAADIPTNTSGINFNAIRAMYAEFQTPASGTRGVASLNDNTANERIALNTSGTDPLLVVVDGGVTQASVDAGSLAANTRTRLAARFNTNDFAVSVNGGQEVVDTSGTMPTLDRLMIGRTQAGEYLNGPLARLVLWTRAPFSLPELTR